MQVVVIEQGTDEWLALKNGVPGDPNSGTLGSSEAGAIRGVSEYYPKTSDELLKLKADYVLPLNQRTVKQVVFNPAMRKGQELEPKVRAYHERLRGESVMPLVARHDDFSFILASLDGINLSGSFIGEYKVSRKTYEMVKQKIVPPQYYAQVQHQLGVSGAQVCDFIAYNPDNKSFAHMEIIPDKGYILELFLDEAVFWQALVDYKTKLLAEPQKLSSSSIVPIEWQTLENEYIRLQSELDDLEFMSSPLSLRQKEIQNALERLMPDGAKRFSGNYINITKTERQGSVDLEKLSADLSIPTDVIDKYRKPSSSSTKLTLIKNKESKND